MAQFKKVSEEHKEVYHYTTAVGLEGILRTQKLCATHMAYLNDPQEHSGFYVRRLPKLLNEASREGVAELMKTQDGREAINSPEVGGPDRAIMDFARELADAALKVAFNINEPYVTSFCSCKAHMTPCDGLLSQWRGYGTDGGYALVFDSAALEESLLEREGPAFHYQFASFSDMDYDFPDGIDRGPHPDRDALESEVREIFKRFIVTRGRERFADLYEKISLLAVRYKHYGFSEEHEVRIVAIPVHDEVHSLALEVAAREGKHVNPRKPIKFQQRRGVLVPYVELFGGQINGPGGNLPIRRVLVGPHADQVRRGSAVRSMVKELGLKVDVEVSGIPYLGR